MFSKRRSFRFAGDCEIPRGTETARCKNTPINYITAINDVKSSLIIINGRNGFIKQKPLTSQYRISNKLRQNQGPHLITPFVMWAPWVNNLIIIIKSVSQKPGTICICRPVKTCKRLRYFRLLAKRHSLRILPPLIRSRCYAGEYRQYVLIIEATLFSFVGVRTVPFSTIVVDL